MDMDNTSQFIPSSESQNGLWNFATLFSQDTLTAPPSGVISQSIFTPWQSSTAPTSVTPSQPTSSQPIPIKPLDAKSELEHVSNFSQMHRLKVEDALSYLDLVKVRFENQPHVYSEFLDVMKEFKSQAIDTSVVISRVSHLFRGNTDLILGFNQFLPPGFRIELSQNEQVTVVTENLQTPEDSVVTSQPVTSSVASPPAVATVSPSKPVTMVTPVTSSPSVPPPTSKLSLQTGQLEMQLFSSPPTSTSGSQPVEFNHAISYVNKIKTRFQDQPDIYKQFLEILHTYQKEQKHLKEGAFPAGQRPLSESEVYHQVARLFKNQEDLLSEFGQFLPDAAGKTTYDRFFLQGSTITPVSPVIQRRISPKPMKRHIQPLVPSSGKESKKLRPSYLKDMSLADAAKAGSLQDFVFFDRIKKALKSPEVYHNFLRCLQLFINSVVSRTELIQMVKPFFGRHPDLYRDFREYLGFRDASHFSERIPSKIYDRQKPKHDLQMEIDFTTCRKYGASYRMLPKTYTGKVCSGRTPLCHEVLNDSWVSFPTWTEEMPSFTCKKTQFEETIFRTEDERYELDIVLETNLATIKVLEVIQRKLSRMSSEEAAKLRLDDTLGGNSDTIHRKAIERVYGDKSPDIIDGLKRSPLVAVPLVLKRLKTKQEEWRLAQKDFNKIWRETYDKYYLKSLDHQGTNFKQTDSKLLRYRSLVNEIEVAFDERQEVKEDSGGAPTEGPHMLKTFSDKETLPDVYDLLIYHAKRQASAHKEDKHQIKVLLKRTLPDMLFMSHGVMSDDEESSSSESEPESDNNNGAVSTRHSRRKRSERRKRMKKGEKAAAELEPQQDNIEDMDMGKAGIIERFLHGQQGSQSPNPSEDAMSIESDKSDDQAEKYTLFYGNNYFYSFLRLLLILCERIAKMKKICTEMAQEKMRELALKQPSSAVVLGLRTPHGVEPDKYYEHFIDMVKKLLDGNMEIGFFEDSVRDVYGIQAFIAFTLDKAVQSAVRQLQHIVTEDASQQLIDLHKDLQSRHATGGYVSSRHKREQYEANYQRKAEQILGEENCVKMLMYRNSMQVSFELLDGDNSETESANEVRQWSQYIERFFSCEHSISDDMREAMQQKPVFLTRNIRPLYTPFTREPDDPGADPSTDDNLTDPSQTPFTDPYTDQGSFADPSKDDVVDPSKDDDDLAETKDEMDVIPQPDLYQKDTLEIQFRPNQYKIGYLTNTEHLQYRAGGLPKARRSHRTVSLAKYDKLMAWISKCVEERVSGDQLAAFEDFLLGEDDSTRRVRMLHLDEPPFHEVFKYMEETF